MGDGVEGGLSTVLKAASVPLCPPHLVGVAGGAAFDDDGRRRHTSHNRGTFPLHWCAASVLPSSPRVVYCPVWVADNSVEAAPIFVV